MYGSVGVGTLGFVAGSSAGYPVVGVGVYWLGFIAFLALCFLSPVTVFDERDTQLERRASTATLTASALVMIFAGPGLVVADEIGLYALSPVFEGALYTVSLQGLLFGAVYLWLRHRP